MPLQVGDRVPDATLVDEDGGQVAVQDLLGSPVVLYFYPADFTPGCTAQACSFRDAHEEFVAAGVEVIGVSSDGPGKHIRFRDRHQLPFRLLTDPDGSAQKAFDVPKKLGLLPGRVTYIVDGGGTVRHVFDSQFQARKHVEEALEVVKGLQN
jgi:thioredoxin-dependent peroxiredoxin